MESEEIHINTVNGIKCFDFSLLSSLTNTSTDIASASAEPERTAPEPQQKFWNVSPQAREWSQVYAHFLKAKVRTDIICIVGDDQERFEAHKSILQLRSEGLDKIFDDPPRTEYFLPNISPRIFGHVLNYIYHDSLKRSVKDADALGLLDFDKTFKTYGLALRCVQFLQKHLSVQNAIRVYLKAKEHKLQDLEVSAFQYISGHGRTIFSTEDFATLTVEDLQKLFLRDDLLCTEIGIFNSAIRWGTAYHNRTLSICVPGTGEMAGNDQVVPPQLLRTLLEPVIPLIRFPVMTYEEIGQIVSPSGILTDSERLSLYDYVAAAEDSKPEMLKFINKPRNAIPRKPRCNSMTSDITTKDPSDEPCSSGNMTPPGSALLPISVDILDTQTSRLAELTSHMSQSRTSTSSASFTPQLSQLHTGRNRKRQAQVHPNLDTETSTSQLLQHPNSYADLPDLIYRKDGCGYKSLEDFVDKLKHNSSEVDLNTTVELSLQNVTITDIYSYPTVTMNRMQDAFTLDLKVNDLTTRDDILRFEQCFDIRRFLFFRLNPSNVLKLDELWDLRIPITLKINGVTYLKMDKNKKELTIAFRNQSKAILSGLGKTHKLLKLNLLKTDIPRFDGFPCRYLQDVVFYHIWVYSESDVAEFVRKCPNLATFSCWAICPWYQHGRKKEPVLSPTELDLTKDFVSGSKLQHLGLFKVVLTFTPRRTPKDGLTNLYLDHCSWPDSFGDNIHLLFPNLKRFAVRNKKPEDQVSQNFKSTVTVRMVYNLIQLPRIEWIRIWGLNWTERFLTEPKNSRNTKNLRSTTSPITDEEVVSVKSLLQSCNINDDADNFALLRNPATNTWVGRKFNEKELTQKDDGFWDLMDRYDFEYYKLVNFYTDYETFQNNFEDMLSDLP